MAYAATGNREKALETLRRLQELAASEYVDPLAMAAVQVGMNDMDGAVDSLRKAVTQRSPMAAFLNVDPVFRQLRGDLRFQSLLSALNLG